MKKKTYIIALEGCDDETVFEMDLTEEEKILLQNIAAKVNETSTYGCMPRMYVRDKDD